jgi:diadenosine tetraphosphate (Ap4A) HIT family hydrolase
MSSTCPLCLAPGGQLIFQGDAFRVVRADEELDFPAFYRVVWNRHVAEFSDLSSAEQLLCMRAVGLVESALREVLRPEKINLASLGNVVPHLHWHVIARFAWDNRFPAPVWAAAQRPVDAQRHSGVLAQRAALESLMLQRLELLTGD